MLLYISHRRGNVADSKSEILQGTLDLMVLKTLDAMGPLHGYGIAKRIEQISDEALQVNQGTIYLCLVRLLQKRWISAEWGNSENNARSSFTRSLRQGVGSSRRKLKTGAYRGCHRAAAADTGEELTHRGSASAHSSGARN